jgi:hypothetical protein
MDLQSAYMQENQRVSELATLRDGWFDGIGQKISDRGIFYDLSAIRQDSVAVPACCAIARRLPQGGLRDLQ